MPGPARCDAGSSPGHYLSRWSPRPSFPPHRWRRPVAASSSRSIAARASPTPEVVGGRRSARVRSVVGRTADEALARWPGLRALVQRALAGQPGASVETVDGRAYGVECHPRGSDGAFLIGMPNVGPAQELQLLFENMSRRDLDHRSRPGADLPLRPGGGHRRAARARDRGGDRRAGDAHRRPSPPGGGPPSRRPQRPRERLRFALQRALVPRPGRAPARRRRRGGGHHRRGDRLHRAARPARRAAAARGADVRGPEARPRRELELGSPPPRSSSGATSCSASTASLRASASPTSSGSSARCTRGYCARPSSAPSPRSSAPSRSNTSTASPGPTARCGCCSPAPARCPATMAARCASPAAAGTSPSAGRRPARWRRPTPPCAPPCRPPPTASSWWTAGAS